MSDTDPVPPAPTVMSSAGIHITLQFPVADAEKWEAKVDKLAEAFVAKLEKALPGDTIVSAGVFGNLGGLRDLLAGEG